MTRDTWKSHNAARACIDMYNRKKFRSQTSGKMDKWKAEVGRVRKEKSREEKKKEDQKRESLRRKKIQVREKVGKSRSICVFSNDLWLRRAEK